MMMFAELGISPLNPPSFHHNPLSQPILLSSYRDQHRCHAILEENAQACNPSLSPVKRLNYWLRQLAQLRQN
ncbi:MAG: hypothetical protein ACKO34_09240 [Vampirovibrionales bacterium]